MGTERTDTARLASLDQYRGYTVLGMFFVNFVGGCVAIPAIFKHHHTYLSYADTIMPQFFLAAGFAYRLTWLRRSEKDGLKAATLRALWRNLGLILFGIVYHHLDGRVETWARLEELGPWGVVRTAFQRSPFQTLTHIGVTGLWILPVIGRGTLVRVLYAAGSATAFVILSQAFYHDWVMKRPGIDGGPLGFLTWTIPMLAGSLACDLVLRRPGRGASGWLFVWGCGLMLLGYGLSCLNRVTPPNTLPANAGLADLLVEPPFVPPAVSTSRPGDPPFNLWTMSQRGGSAAYQTCAAGIALVVLALFCLVCDGWNRRWYYLDLLGQNALAGYIIHDLVADAVKPFVPRDAPWWYILAAFCVYLAIISLFLRHLEKHRLYLRL
jgi:predicted acyltransferase